VNGGTATGTVWLIILLILYFVPFGVAKIRGLKHWGSVLVIDLFLGWTGIGWVVALAMACRTKERAPPGEPGG
jgi:Superinfection immunity protein